MSCMSEMSAEQENLSGAFDEAAYNDWLNDEQAQAEHKQWSDNLEKEKQNG